MTLSPGDLDPLVSSRIRAGILAFLSDRGAADFTELATALELPNNTLSSHLQRLESAAYVRLQRGFLGRKPRTRVALTDQGRTVWLTHLERITDTPFADPRLRFLNQDGRKAAISC